MSRATRWLCLFLCGMVSTGTAQPLTESEVLEWWHSARDRADDPDRLNGWTLQWNLVFDHVPSASELNDLRERVENHPDHPDQRDLQRINERLAEPVVWSFAVGIDQDGNWYSVSDFKDTVTVGGYPSPKLAWSLTGTGTLTSINPLKPHPAGAHGISQLHEHHNAVAALIDARTSLRIFINADQPEIQLTAGGARLTVDRSNIGTSRFILSRAPDSSVRPERVEFYENDNPRPIARTSFEGWTRVDGWEFPIATRAIHRSHNAADSRTFELVSLQRSDPAEVHRRSTRPSQQYAQDGVSIPIDTLRDFTNGDPATWTNAGSTFFQPNPDGTVTQSSLRQIDSVRRAKKYQTTIGLCLAGAIAAATVFLAWKSRTHPA